MFQIIELVNGRVWPGAQAVWHLRPPTHQHPGLPRGLVVWMDQDTHDWLPFTLAQPQNHQETPTRPSARLPMALTFPPTHLQLGPDSTSLALALPQLLPSDSSLYLHVPQIILPISNKIQSGSIEVQTESMAVPPISLSKTCQYVYLGIYYFLF